MIKFNEETKKILKRSEIEALNNNNDYVNTEHILLALTIENNSLTKTLSKYNITYDIIKKQIKKDTNKKEYITYNKEILKILEDIIIDEIEEEITVNLLLKYILKNKKTNAYKILKNINININELINTINIEVTKQPLILNELGTNLTLLAKQNKLDKVIGRDKEINRIIEILERKNKNNPILIGEAGVGKTAIIEELARRISLNEVPDKLKNKEIINLNLFNVIAGTKYRGEFEEKLTTIISELENNTNLILFIDEIHTIIGAGGAEGAIDTSNIMKPALARGKLKVIGATTINEYKNSIDKDKALDRRFQKVLITEPNFNETKIILKKIKKNYESYHNVIISDKILDLIINLSNKYITERKNPDKSIDILDEVCSKEKLNNKPNKYICIKNEINKLKTKKLSYLSKNDYKMASLTNEKIKSLNQKIKTNNYKETKNKVTINTLKNVLNNITNTPIYELENKNKFNNIKKDILDKYKSLNYIDTLLENIENHIYKNNNTPTKININEKTNILNTIKDISNSLNINLITLNKNDYLYETSINKIIGTSLSYSTYDEKNTCFDKIKLYPTSIIYINDLSKYPNNIKNLLNDIISTGILNLANNEIINMKNTIFIINETSNTKSKLGFIKETI